MAPNSGQKIAVLASDAMVKFRISSAGMVLSPTATGAPMTCGMATQTVPAILRIQFLPPISHNPTAVATTAPIHHNCRCCTSATGTPGGSGGNPKDGAR